MKEADFKSDVRVIERIAGEIVIIEGDLTESTAREFEQEMRSLTSRHDSALALDLSALDIDDGVAVATAINAIRELLARSTRLIIKGAPQILGHNLYRARMLGKDSPIELVDMRLDEAS